MRVYKEINKNTFVFYFLKHGKGGGGIAWVTVKVKQRHLQEVMD